MTYNIYDRNLFLDFKIDEKLKYRWYGEEVDIEYQDFNEQITFVSLELILKPFQAVIYNDRVYELKEDRTVFTDDLQYAFVYENEVFDDVNSPLVYKLAINNNDDVQ